MNIKRKEKKSITYISIICIFRVNIFAIYQSVNVSATIIVTIAEEIRYKSGLFVKYYPTRSFICGSDDVESYVKQNKVEAIWEDVEGFTSSSPQNNLNVWREKTGFSTLSFNFMYELESNIMVERAQSYTFYINADRQQTKLFIDDIVVLDLINQCNAYNESSNGESVTLMLEEGIHKYKLFGYAARSRSTFEVSDYKLVLRYSTETNATVKQIPFIVVDPLFNPITELSIDSYIHYLPLNLKISLSLSFKGISKNYICNSTDNLPDGLYISDNLILGYTTKVQELKSYTLYCRNDYSVTNYVTIYLSVNSIFYCFIT